MFAPCTAMDIFDLGPVVETATDNAVAVRTDEDPATTHERSSIEALNIASSII